MSTVGDGIFGKNVPRTFLTQFQKANWATFAGFSRLATDPRKRKTIMTSGPSRVKKKAAGRENWQKSPLAPLLRVL